MADEVHTRQMTLQEMAQQLDEMRLQQSELKGEIGDKFSEMKSDLLGILKQALKLPEQAVVASPSASSELDGIFESLESSWTKTLSQGSWNFREPETMKKYDPFVEPLKDDSALQVLDPVPDVLMIYKVDSKVEEPSQQSTNGNDKIVAHQVFDVLPNDLTVNELSPFDTLNTYSRPPQPPDPPDCKSHTEFLKFDGTLLHEWIRRCDQYFYLHKTLPEMKVRIASPHMIGKALEWHTNYIRNNFGMFPPWLDYTIAITAQFGDNDVLPMHRAPFSPYQNQNNRSHYNIPNTTSLLPPLETTKSLPYKPNFPPETNMEKSQILQGSEMRGLGRPSDGSQANGNHLEIKKPQVFVMECEDATITGDETIVETNSLLEKETISSSALCEQDFATQSQDFNVIQQEKLIHDTETIMEMGPIQEHESLGFTDSISKADFVPSQFQVPIPSLELSSRRQKESLAGINDQSCDLGCVISKSNGCICDSELVQANSHDKKEFKGLNLGKLLRNERLLSIVCLFGLNDMSCWTQLLRQQIFPKSWRFKFKTGPRESKLLNNKFFFVEESSGEAILLNTYRAVCLDVYNRNLETDLGIYLYEYKNQMLLLGYHGLEVQVLSCLQEFGEGPKTDTHIVLCWKELASFLWFLHGKKLLDAGQKMQSMLVSDFKTWVPHFGYELRLAGTDPVLGLFWSSFESDMNRLWRCPEDVLSFNSEMSYFLSEKSLVGYKAHGRDLLVVGVKQFILAATKFLLKHKWRSKFGSNKLTRTWTSYSRYDSSSCALRQEENYVLVLFIIIGALTLFNDQHTLVAEKNRTETSIVLKQIFGTHQDYYLLLFLERVKATFEIMLTVEHFENPLASILTYEVFHLQRPPESSTKSSSANILNFILEDKDVSKREVL